VKGDGFCLPGADWLFVSGFANLVRTVAMSEFWTCPQGHRWSASVATPPLEPGAEAICPICAAAAQAPGAASPTITKADTPPPHSPSQTDDLRLGDLLEQMKRPLRPVAPEPVLPGYEIVEELGRGGMGVVYKARQQGLNRLVALKMILTGPYSAPEERRRFQREAEAVARLRHPGIVQIYEVGEYDDRPYFSMEYLEGGNLAQKLAGTTLPGRSAAELVETLARAIQAAHECGIIHRDLKPANVLLAADGTPKIGDFGLAKLVDAAGEMTIVGGQTQSGAILGTPSYIAPEQAAGQVKKIGPATDVYALGAIFYEVLTGRPPFLGASVLATLEQVRTQEPVSPSRLQLGLPRDLQTICLKCLEKEPARRYQAATDLADDLARFREGRPIRARPVRSAERLLKWARRQPKLAALTLVCCLALTGVFVGGAVYQYLLQRALHQAEVSAAEARQEQEHAEASAAEAHREQERATANYRMARDTIHQMLGRLSDPRVAGLPRLKELQRHQREDALRFFERIIRQQDNPDPAVRLDVALAYRQAGVIQGELGRGEEAVANCRRALALLGQLAAENPAQGQYRYYLAGVHCNLGVLGDPREREDHYRQALQLHEELVRADPGLNAWRTDRASIHQSLGALYQVTNRLKEAETEYLEAVKVIATPAAGTGSAAVDSAADAHILAEARINLGLLYHQTNRLPQAAREFEQAEVLLDWLRRNAPHDSGVAYSLAGLHANAGNLLKDRKQPEAALARFAQAIEVATQTLQQEPEFAPARQVLSQAYAGRAALLAGLGRHREAAFDRERVVALLPAEQRDYQRLFLADALVRAGDHTRAVAEAESLSALLPANTHWVQFYHLAKVCSLAVTCVRDERGLPVLGASSTGLLVSPWGQAPLQAATALFPTRIDARRLSPAERDARAERYAALSVTFLGKARASLDEEKRWLYLLDLMTNDTFKPLRHRADFQRVIETNKKK
jgi:tetratricopeptide (TPR) repeat protein/tRNA A-37 threonylcarbamoyl transferase component Bud32